MQEIDINSLGQQVLWAAFGLALLFGIVAQRTHFCTMGAVADIVNMGDWARMRMWALAIGVAMLGFNGMVAMGWVEAGKSIYAGSRLLWLSYAVGGLFFGVGMVLASGCGNKTLLRIGSGNLKSLVVFVVMGIAAFATMKGITAVARVATVDQVLVELGSGQDLPSLLGPLLGMAKPQAAMLLGALLGGGLLLWSLMRAEGRNADVLLGGFGMGALVVGLWWVSGVFGRLVEHPQTLEEAFIGSTNQRMESFTFTAPIAYVLDWLMYFSDKSKVLTLAIVSTLGVIAGSTVYSLVTRSFRWEGFRGIEDTANHLVGAVLMGVGGVTAMGCTVGQGLSGVSTLSLGSFIALAGIIGGAVLGLRYQMWRLERMA
jgi:uncharacterized membrane protein YedE/YeeE